MSTASLIAHQARYDLRTSMRDPRARGLTLALPVLLLLLFGYIFRHETFSYEGTTVSGVSYYLSRMIVLDVVGSTLSNLVVNVVTKRETGALKRRRYRAEASRGRPDYVSVRPREIAISPVRIISISPNGRTMFSKALILSVVPVISMMIARLVTSTTLPRKISAICISSPR